MIKVKVAKTKKLNTIHYMNNSSNSNRRRFTRIHIFKDVTIYTGMRSWMAQIHDLSLKGALLSCQEDHSIKAGDLLRLSIPIQNSPAIIMNIQVVHTNANTFGVEWTQIDMDSFAILKRTIELNTTEQDQLRKDIKTLAE